MHPLLTRAAEAPPSIKWVASIVTALTAIIGTAFAVDGRYVHADDFKDFAQQTQRTLNDNRQQQIEDKIFELELKVHRTNNEDALLNHYKQQLQDINAKVKGNQP